MQAVRTAGQTMLSPEEQAEWLRVVEELGAKRQLLAVPKSIENGLQSGAVVEFLCQVWEDEEQKRRHRDKWAVPVLGASFIALILVVLGVALWTMITGMKRPKDAAIVGVIAQGFFFWMLGFTAQKRRGQRALAFLLTNCPTVPPCAVLIEALEFGGFSQDAKSRLMTSLPHHQDSDVPTFNEHQNRTLLSVLKSGLTRHMKSGRSYFTDTDIGFLAVLIRFFEKEAMSGKAVPREIAPLLTRFVACRLRTDVSPRWNAVRIAAENYLIRLGEHGSTGGAVFPETR